MPGKNRKINLKNRMLDAYKTIYTYEDTQNALERSKPEPGDNYSAQFASNFRNYNKSRNMVKTFRIALKNVFTDDDVIMDMLDKCMTDAEKEKMKKE
ncbi:MAG: hypothetical protein IKR27_06370, partial [Lachnospiraceae bacterium]|nr:hypothetical protein [Lachnospiraceae bacterium]